MPSTHAMVLTIYFLCNGIHHSTSINDHTKTSYKIWESIVNLPLYCGKESAHEKRRTIDFSINERFNGRHF